MKIDPTYSASEEPMDVQEVEHLVMPRFGDRRQTLKIANKLTPIGQIANAQFTDDQRMHQQAVARQQVRQHRVRFTDMADPYGSVGEDHSSV